MYGKRSWIVFDIMKSYICGEKNHKFSEIQVTICFFLSNISDFSLMHNRYNLIQVNGISCFGQFWTVWTLMITSENVCIFFLNLLLHLSFS